MFVLPLDTVVVAVIDVVFAVVVFWSSRFLRQYWFLVMALAVNLGRERERERERERLREKKEKGF